APVDLLARIVTARAAGLRGLDALAVDNSRRGAGLAPDPFAICHHAKNVKTLWRDAEKLIGEDGARQMVDPLCVIETCMRYFYSLAQTGRKANAPLDEVRKCFEKAAHLAALAAPYRHPRLSAVKLNKDPVDPALRQEASLEELRVQMQKHWERLAPVLDLEAL